MSKSALADLAAQIRALRPADAETVGVDAIAVRRTMDAMSPPNPLGLDVREIDIMRELPLDHPDYHDEDAVFLVAEWLVPRGARTDVRLVYLHGGAYIAGSRRSHRGLASRIARAIGCVALVPEYRLAPEHPFPAALEDARLALAHAFGHGPDGESPATAVILAGDSAGGGLTISTLVSARDDRARLPVAAVTLSAWTDLEGKGESVRTRAELDPMIPPALIPGWARLYLGDRDPATPLASPVNADLTGLPPLLMQVGDHEVLLDDTVRVAERAEAAGVQVALEVWPEAFHVFQAFAGAIPEGRQAIEHIGRFCRAHAGIG